MDAEIFERRLQERLKSEKDKDEIRGSLVEEVMEETIKEVKEKVKSFGFMDNNFPDVNMILLFPTKDGGTRGAFFGDNQTRTVVFRGEKSLRVGEFDQNNESALKLKRPTCTFDLEAGDLLFCSSDGIWKHCSPTEVGAFVKTRMQQTNNSLKTTVTDLVSANIPEGVPRDDMNPILLQIP